MNMYYNLPTPDLRVRIIWYWSWLCW
jgi:hypothetical protein